ncbi:hypothetical protein LPJ81_000949 [Coemansia sp. IMI 209127]|nr:hypothetical protein LPJ81_000949 [Coemansia sp. IMI 209127]
MVAATHSLMQQQFSQAARPAPPLPSQYPHPHSAPVSHQHHHHQQGMPQLVSPQQQQQRPTQQAPLVELKPNFYNPYHVKHRRRTSKDQLALLEGTFKTTPKPSSELRKQLATALHMSAREVQIWFQNRRAKQKNMMLRASSNTGTAPSNDPSSKAIEAMSVSPAMMSVDAATVSSSLVSALLPSPNYSSRQQRQEMFARTSSVENAAAGTPQHLKHALTASASPSSCFGLKEGITPPPPHALRRHSDIPTSYVGSSQSTASTPATACAAAATRHNGPPIEEQHMPSAVATALGAVTAIATAPAAAAAECTSPQAMAFAAAMAAAAASSSMPPCSPNGFIRQQQHSNAYGMTSPPRSALQMPMQLSKKQKKPSNGPSGADSYHVARVHHEAFDGTNKLPLKPDDLSSQSADDQFHLLDPANLPNFMMPGPSSAPSVFGASGGGGGNNNSSSMLYGGIGGGSSDLGSLVSGPFASQQQPNVRISADPNPGLYWDAPYAADQQHQGQQQHQQHQHQQHGLLSAHQMPQTDISLLFSGLLGMSPNVYSPGLSVNTTATTGMMQPSNSYGSVSSTDSALSPPNSAISVEATSLYNTLLSLTQQSQPDAIPQHHHYLHHQHGAVAAGNGYASHEMSPASTAAESVAMASPAPPHSSSANQPPPLVHTIVGAGHKHHRQQGGGRGDCGAAMFMPSASFPQLIASGIAEASVLGVSNLFSESPGSPTRTVMAGEGTANRSNSSISSTSLV